MSIFDFIRERISNIDLDVLSIDSVHPTWDFADLTMLLDSLEKEWKEKHPDELESVFVSREPEHEYAMEEFMYGQDLGNPEDGSL